MPATHPLPHVFPSPVPTQTVSTVASLGSTVIEPTVFLSNEAERYGQWGSPVSTLSVRHTPPPDVAAQSVHCPGTQSGPIAKAVVRPPAAYSFGTYVAFVRNGEKGYRALLGPTVTHVPGRPLPLGKPLDLMALAAVSAASSRDTGRSESGKPGRQNQDLPTRPW